MKHKILIFFIINCIGNNFKAQIRILLSAALAPTHFNFRRDQYIKSFQQLLKFGYGPHSFYIVESLKKQGPTFLNDYCNNVFYATTNNPKLRNNGINEAVTTLEASYHFKFHPEDYIIKITGRHYLRSPHLINTVKHHPEYDAFVKTDGIGNVFTVGFAMKCKYFQEMHETMDYAKMERQHISLEHEVALYLQKKIKQGNFKILFMDKLDIIANNFASTTAPGAPENIIVF